MFKRPTAHYGEAPAPVTPCQKEAPAPVTPCQKEVQVWDKRVGSARVQAKN